LPTRPPPEDLLPWALAELAVDPAKHRCALKPVAGDASNRRYHRLFIGSAHYVLAEAPPDTEKNSEFLAARELLGGAGVRVPGLFAADLSRGYFLLEDLGDRLLLAELRADSADNCYRGAFDVLLRMAALEVLDSNWPAYDSELLHEELGRFPRWYVRELLGGDPQGDASRICHELAELLVSNAMEQPTVFVHRDFHSRNLMPQPDGSLGVIDFQDAVIGPVTYDLVSLLKDCYIRWPAERVREWALAYRGRLCDAGLLESISQEQFLRWFDLMGLQRHIKVLGTFARLYLRDGKQGYLADLPLVSAYVLETLSDYSAGEPAIRAFADWFQHELEPRLEARPWSGGQ